LAWLRDIDRWLIDAVLPGAVSYHALAKRLIGGADAEDLVQEAYARLLAAPDWRSIGNPVAFTMRVVHNLALDRLRRASIVRIDQVAAAEMIEIEDDAPDAHATISAKIELARLIEAVDRLPRQCRMVVRMRKFEGLAPQAIADSLGLSVSTVEKHLARGLAALSAERSGDLAVPERGDKNRPWQRRRSRA
jgi:RNA polymerase sigma factor (sigma-70 family)